MFRCLGYEISTGRARPYPSVALRDFYHAWNRYSETWDWRLLSEVSKAAQGRPVLILADNVEVHHRMVRNLFSNLRAHNVPAVIVGAVRALDWSNIVEDHPMPGFQLARLPDDLNPDEVAPFVKYLERRGLISVDLVTTIDYWSNRVAGHHEHHLLGVMRSLSSKAEEAFDQKILSEYGNIPELAKKAYETICLVYQFGYPIPLDLLLIALNCSEVQFAEEVLAKDRDHVIMSAAATLSGRIAYRARHRVIAEIVASHVWASVLVPAIAVKLCCRPAHQVCVPRRPDNVPDSEFVAGFGNSARAALRIVPRVRLRRKPVKLWHEQLCVVSPVDEDTHNNIAVDVGSPTTRKLNIRTGLPIRFKGLHSKRESARPRS